MKKYLMLILLAGFFKTGFSQTLQTVTDNGNITTNGITIGTGHTGAKFNVNAYGMDANGSNDVSMIVANQRYNSTNSAGENRIVLGWANHWAAAIGAYKESTNISGLRFYTEYGFNTPQEKMRITGAGNVGIGTTNPLSKLQIATSDKTGEIRIGGANGVNSGRVFIAADMVNDRSYIDVYGDNTFKKLFIDASVLTLNNVSNGNVGIGTANTQGYKLAVNGSIRAKEIKVESANWPDYVFTKDYKLPSLSETENHIKERGHLPGIPSAAEVKENGIELGEMNKKLLQKIEELTMHLIEQEKRINSQDQKLTEQSEMIKALTLKRTK